MIVSHLSSLQPSRITSYRIFLYDIILFLISSYSPSFYITLQYCHTFPFLLRSLMCTPFSTTKLVQFNSYSPSLPHALPSVSLSLSLCLSVCLSVFVLIPSCRQLFKSAASLYLLGRPLLGLFHYLYFSPSFSPTPFA